jgi:hypothetical protein
MSAAAIQPVGPPARWTTPPSGVKPTGALAGVHPVDSISRDVRPALGADLTALYPQLRRYATRTTW